MIPKCGCQLPTQIFEVPYSDDVPQVDAVAALLKKYGSVAGLKTMTIMPASSQTAETDAKKRAGLLAQAMKLKGDVTKQAAALTEADIKALADRGKNVADYAEVIRIE